MPLLTAMLGRNYANISICFISHSEMLMLKRKYVLLATFSFRRNSKLLLEEIRKIYYNNTFRIGNFKPTLYRFCHFRILEKNSYNKHVSLENYFDFFKREDEMEFLKTVKFYKIKKSIVPEILI